MADGVGLGGAEVTSSATSVGSALGSAGELDWLEPADTGTRSRPFTRTVSPPTAIRLTTTSAPIRKIIPTRRRRGLNSSSSQRCSAVSSS